MLRMTSTDNGKMFLTLNDGTEIMIIVKYERSGLVWLFDAPKDVSIERDLVRTRRLKEKDMAG